MVVTVRMNEGLDVIVGVWKVLAALLHHLLNGASAVSSQLESGAEASVFGVCFTVASLHATL